MYYSLVGWLVFNDNTRDTDDTTVGVGHSRRYCNTGYDQSQGRRPSTLKCIGPISKGDIEPQPSRQKLIRNRTASRLRSDGRSRRYVQYRADQSQTETIIANHPFRSVLLFSIWWGYIIYWNERWVPRLLNKFICSFRVYRTDKLCDEYRIPNICQY